MRISLNKIVDGDVIEVPQGTRVEFTTTGGFVGPDSLYVREGGQWRPLRLSGSADTGCVVRGRSSPKYTINFMNTKVHQFKVVRPYSHESNPRQPVEDLFTVHVRA